MIYILDYFTIFELLSRFSKSVIYFYLAMKIKILRGCSIFSNSIDLLIGVSLALGTKYADLIIVSTRSTADYWTSFWFLSWKLSVNSFTMGKREPFATK